MNPRFRPNSLPIETEPSHSTEVAEASMRPYDAFRLRQERADTDAIMDAEADELACGQSASPLMAFVFVCGLSMLAWCLFGLAWAGHAVYAAIAGSL